MKSDETKILESLYKRGKSISKPNHFQAPNYFLGDILNDVGLEEENAKPFLETLLAKGYIEWDRSRIRLTAPGLEYSQETFEKRAFGFLSGEDKS